MAGSYNGPDMWGGSSTWWEQVTGTSYESSAIYRANKEANSFYIPLPGSGAGHVVVGEAPTSGPGVRGVGSAPTGGPGVVRVGKPVGHGPGLGVVTVGDHWVDGPLIPEGGAFTIGDSTRTPLMVGGRYLHINQGLSDGGDFEQRWGEFGGSVAGLGVMASDLASDFMATHGPGASKALSDVTQVLRDATPKDANGKTRADRLREGFWTWRQENWGW